MTDGPGYLSRPIDAPQLEKHKDGIKGWPSKWSPDALHEFMPERWLVEKEDGGIEFDPNAGPVCQCLLFDWRFFCCVLTRNLTVSPLRPRFSWLLWQENGASRDARLLCYLG